MKGQVNGFAWSAQVFPLPSCKGIDHGQVHQLQITDPEGTVVAHYDWGWVTRPGPTAEGVYETVMRQLT